MTKLCEVNKIIKGSPNANDPLYTCYTKAKHSAVVRSEVPGIDSKMVVRLCDEHFDLMYGDFHGKRTMLHMLSKKMGEAQRYEEDKNAMRINFRRNRL